jgi:DNA polymerase-3 subunit epsilon
MVCTLTLARQKFPGAKHSLDALCTRFGVDRSQRIKHGALLDAQLLAQVYVELTGGRQIGLTLVAELIGPESALGGESGAAPAAVTVRPPRPHAPSEAELARHAAFLAGIADPIWNRLFPRG